MRVEVNGTELFFDVEGSALVANGGALLGRPTLLVLHGGPGFDHTYFKPHLSHLADVFQIVYLDQRGQGRSGRPPRETCTVEQMAADAAELCRVLNIEKPVVLGHSFGGFVALALALDHPHAVSRLILLDSAAHMDLDEALSILAERHGAEARAVAEKFFAGDASDTTVADFGRLVFPAYVHPSRINVLMDALPRLSFDPGFCAYWFQHHRSTYDYREQLSTLRVPTLVVVGDYDWITPPSHSRALVAGIAGAELAVIPNAGHQSFAERPEIFGAAVRRFTNSATPG